MVFGMCLSLLAHTRVQLEVEAAEAMVESLVAPR